MGSENGVGNLIDSTFVYGKNFKIGHYCIIEEGVVVGDNVTIRNYVTLQKGTRIRDDVYVGSYFRSGGNDVIGRGTTLKCKSTSSPDTIIGSRVFLGPHALILHKKHTGEHVPCEIGNDVYIGANATIAPGVMIDDSAIIGAGAYVTRNCESGKTYVGVPAKELIRP